MEGLFFYWTAWMAWVVITFFMEKGESRTEAVTILLVVIMFSNQYITIYGFDINISLLVMLFYAYQKFGALSCSRLVYAVIVCHIITLAYIGFSMYILYDPVILWIDKTWITAGLIFLLVQFLIKPFSLKCLAAIIGICHGNLLYSFMMKEFSLTAGSLMFFDLLALCLAMIAVWHGYGVAARFLSSHFRRSFQQKSHSHVRSGKDSISRTNGQ